MPRSGGIYTLPSGYLAVTGETVTATQHNPPLEDLAASMTNSVPRDGTGPMQAALPMGGFKVTGMGTGVDPTDAATVAQLDSVMPIGMVVQFAGTSAPTNWLFCYGQAVSRSTYAGLFAALGTAFGVGDGSTTFNLPDCRGRVAAGKDNMGGTSADRLTNQSGGLNGDTLGATGGTETHTLTEAQLAAHTHTFTGDATGAQSANHTHVVGGATNSAVSNATQRFLFGGSSGAADVTTAGISANHTHTTSGTNAATGSGTAHNNMQPTIVFNTIILAL